PVILKNPVEASRSNHLAKEPAPQRARNCTNHCQARGQASALRRVGAIPVGILLFYSFRRMRCNEPTNCTGRRHAGVELAGWRGGGRRSPEPVHGKQQWGGRFRAARGRWETAGRCAFTSPRERAAFSLQLLRWSLLWPR